MNWEAKKSYIAKDTNDTDLDKLGQVHISIIHILQP